MDVILYSVISPGVYVVEVIVAAIIVDVFVDKLKFHKFLRNDSYADIMDID